MSVAKAFPSLLSQGGVYSFLLGHSVLDECRTVDPNPSQNLYLWVSRKLKLVL